MLLLLTEPYVWFVIFSDLARCERKKGTGQGERIKNQNPASSLLASWSHKASITPTSVLVLFSSVCGLYHTYINAKLLLPVCGGSVAVRPVAEEINFR